MEKKNREKLSFNNKDWFRQRPLQNVSRYKVRWSICARGILAFIPKKENLIHHNAQISVGFLLLPLPLPLLLIVLLLLLSILLGFLFTNHRFSFANVSISCTHTRTLILELCLCVCPLIFFFSFIHNTFAGLRLRQIANRKKPHFDC